MEALHTFPSLITLQPLLGARLLPSCSWVPWRFTGVQGGFALILQALGLGGPPTVACSRIRWCALLARTTSVCLSLARPRACIGCEAVCFLSSQQQSALLPPQQGSLPALSSCTAATSSTAPFDSTHYALTPKVSDRASPEAAPS